MITVDLSLLIRDAQQPSPRECNFLLGSLATRVCIRLHVGEDGLYSWEQSHFIRTPLQIDAYRTSCPSSDTEERAWRAAFRTLTQQYEWALREGYKPENSWLLPNEDWR